MNNGFITIDEFEKLCEASTAKDLKVDIYKAAEGLDNWLDYAQNTNSNSTGNYTIWLVKDRKRIGTRTLHMDTRREYERVRNLIEDTYKRLAGAERRTKGVRYVSSVMDDKENPTGQIRVTKKGMAEEGEVVSSGATSTVQAEQS